MAAVAAAGRFDSAVAAGLPPPPLPWPAQNGGRVRRTTT